MALDPQKVIAVRNTILLLKRLPVILTPETQADFSSAQRTLDEFFCSAEVRDELIGAWLACNGEYAALINALTPVMNRVIQCIQQRAAPAPDNGGTTQVNN